MGTGHILWWGYKHTNGSLQVKRYFDKRYIDEAGQSPFVARFHGPFEANNRAEALEILEEREILFTDKKL